MTYPANAAFALFSINRYVVTDNDKFISEVSPAKIISLVVIVTSFLLAIAAWTAFVIMPYVGTTFFLAYLLPEISLSLFGISIIGSLIKICICWRDCRDSI
jgi:hypothetical protein